MSPTAKPEEPEKDYFRCPDGHMHTLEFRRLGDEGDQYTCRNCRFEAEKRDLKKNTDRTKVK